ncbi:MAG TPA: hypothetical protein VL992_17225 [Tepidisphaeraceae bacterium]|nr:hypothetical protein [Tepidisphaeraceae bacterium]
MTSIFNLNRGRTARFEAAGSVIHVRYAGQSFDVPLASLDVDAGTNDRLIRQAVANRLLLTQDRLADYVIDRHANGNLTIRPEAVFG